MKKAQTNQIIWIIFSIMVLVTIIILITTLNQNNSKGVDSSIDLINKSFQNLN